MDSGRIEEVLLQMLETEIAGASVHLAAIRCAVDENLRRVWQRYLDELQEHVAITRQVLVALGIDAERETPGRIVVRFKGEALLRSMEMALEAGDEQAAQLVAAEAVVEAEYKAHANWELVGKVAAEADGELTTVLGDAYEQVKDQKSEHRFHSAGWVRELWIGALGMPPVLPPPEERKKVKTPIGASRAEQEREAMVDEPTPS